jgi:hypothetical protein
MADFNLLLKRKALGTSKPVVSQESKYETSRFSQEKEDNRRMHEQGRIHWEQLANARNRANRTFLYYIGQQWSERMAVMDKNGKEEWITEYEYIKRQGRIPFVQNLMLATGNTIKGQYLAAPSQCIVQSRDRDDQDRANMLSAALDEELDANNLPTLDPMMLESFIISGIIAETNTWGPLPTKDRAGLKITPINYNHLIVNNYSDPRGTDVNFCGHIIDTTINAILSTFCESKQDEDYIRAMYKGHNKQLFENMGVSQTGSSDHLRNLSYEMPADVATCRIYCLWEKRLEWRMAEHDYLNGTLVITKRTRAEVEAENAQRTRFCIDNGVQPDPKLHLIDATERMCEYWFYKYLTPFWDCLAFGESPYDHKGHPFTFTLHPMLNGRVYGFMETMIDLNRQINRNYSLRDAMLGGAAKNVMVLDQGMLEGDNAMDIEGVTEEMGKINGVVVLNLKGQALAPQFMNGNTASLGINDMIERDINLILKLNGLGQAIRGETPASGTPAERYKMELAQSQTNLLPVFTAFNNHIKERGMKSLSLIRQYKEDGLLRSKKNQKQALEYKSAEARAIKDMDMTVAQSTDTPTYRQVGEDTLMQFLSGGLISIKQMLKQSSLPFADGLLQSIESAEAEQAQQQGGGMSPQMQGALQNAQQQIQGANTNTPEQQALVDRALGG